MLKKEYNVTRSTPDSDRFVPFNRGFRSQTIETIKSLFVFLPATYFTNESRILTRRKLGESLFCGAKNAPRPQKVVARE